MNEEPEVTMKCLLAVAIKEALRLAILDSIAPNLKNQDDDGLTDEQWASISEHALAANLCCRLLGFGGWMVGGVYSGNATPSEIFEASIENPLASPIPKDLLDKLKPGDLDWLVGEMKKEPEL